MWRLGCWLVILCFAGAAEDERCLEDSSSEYCRQREAPKQPSRQSRHEEKAQRIEPETKEPPDFLPVVTMFQSSDQQGPIAAAAVIVLRMPRGLQSAPGPVISPLQPKSARPHKRFFLQLIVHAREKRLLFFDALSAELLLEYETDDEIVLMEAHGDRLLCARKDNSLRLYKVQASTEETEDTSPPDKRSKESVASVPILRLKVEVDVEVAPYVTHHTSQELGLPAATSLVEEPPRVTSLAIMMTKGRMTWLVAGYDDGHVVSFRPDGSMKMEVVTHNKTVVAVAHGQGANLMIMTEQGYGMMRSNVKSLFSFCPTAKNHTVINGLAPDPVNTYLLYGVSRDGRLLVYNIKNRDCKPKYDVKIAESGDLRLAVTRGYILITSNENLYVYNVTNLKPKEPPQLAFSRPLSGVPSGDATKNFEHSVAPLLISTLRESNEEYVVLTQLSSSRSMVLASYLPFTDDSKGSGMFRLPLLLGAIVAMGFFQMYKKRKAAVAARHEPLVRDVQNLHRDVSSLRRGVLRPNSGNRRMGLTAGRRAPPARPTRSYPEGEEDGDADNSDPEERTFLHQASRSKDD